MADSRPSAQAVRLSRAHVCTLPRLSAGAASFAAEQRHESQCRTTILPGVRPRSLPFVLRVAAQHGQAPRSLAPLTVAAFGHSFTTTALLTPATPPQTTTRTSPLWPRRSS